MAGYDLGFDLAGLFSKKYCFYRICFLQIHIRHRNMKYTVDIYRNRFRQIRNHVFVFQTNLFRFQRACHQIIFLVYLIQIKNMIGRSFDHFLTLCQDHRLQNIDHLCDICHLDAVAVFVEEIQVDTCNQCVTHGILLIQKSRIRSRLYIIPGTPLVHDHADLFIRIVLIHNGTVTADQLFHVHRLFHGLIPVFFRKFRCTALVIPGFRNRVVMKRQAIHHAMLLWGGSAEACFHHFLRPLIIIRVGTTGNFPDFPASIVITHKGLISAVHISVEFRIHISAAAPVLIADAEEIDGPRFFVAIFRTKVCHRRYTVKCHIFNPLRHLLYGTASHISVDIGLTSDLTAELKKFVGTETVVLDNAAPVGVDHFFAAFFRSDTVFPVIFICKTSARPAQYRNFDIFQCFNNIGTHSIHVRNIGIFSYIESFINTSSQMLRKLSLDFLIDF